MPVLSGDADVFGGSAVIHTTKTVVDRKLSDGTTYWRYECTCGQSETFLYKSNATKAGDAHYLSELAKAF